jgi:two-component system response regulator PilR (NtrC family)
MANNAVLNNAQVLVVDDEPDLRTLYELTLLREGYRVDTAGTVQEASELLDVRRFDIVVTDMRLPDGTGTEILKRLKVLQRPERCIVITAYGSAENAVDSLKAGAFDYLTKPVDLKQFRAVVASAVQEASANPSAATSTVAATGAGANTTARAQNSKSGATAGRTDAAQGSLARLAGSSAAISTVKDRIVKVARSMAPVLIWGESGTGKELVASALHTHSHRSEGPWVAVNCSAIPENLLEAEFFGARKGAYTGSTHDREGFFQTAHGGTLFLDEIGDLPLLMQSKLLRAIQERRVRPLGTNQEETVDVRIVSATHKDLGAEVAAGRFRQDLFYRLNVIDIFIPPLRERLEDLPELCAALLQRIAQDAGIAPPHLSAAALENLGRLPLKGNVRELENLLHRAVALAEGDELRGEDFSFAPISGPAPLSSPPSGSTAPVPANTPSKLDSEFDPSRTASIPSDLQSHLDQQEREILVKTLQETRFNRTLAASRLGLSLRQIRYRIARLKIDTSSAPEEADDA